MRNGTPPAVAVLRFERHRRISTTVPERLIVLWMVSCYSARQLIHFANFRNRYRCKYFGLTVVAGASAGGVLSLPAAENRVDTALPRGLCNSTSGLVRPHADHTRHGCLPRMGRRSRPRTAPSSNPPSPVGRTRDLPRLSDQYWPGVSDRSQISGRVFDSPDDSDSRDPDCSAGHLR